MTPLIAEIPSWLPTFAIVCIAVALVALFGLILLLRGMRELSSGLTDMVKRELGSMGEATKVNVQQPFVVKQHDPCTPLEQHNQLVTRVTELSESVDERLQGMSEANAASREKIYNQLRDQAQSLSENTAKTDLTHQRVETLDGKIDRILERLPRNA